MKIYTTTINRFIFFKIILITFLVLFIFNINSFASTKVACIGDSLTYGTKIDDKKNFSYPAQLQRKLGELYEVKNFGLPNSCAEINTTLPYIMSNEFKSALDYNADIYVLMLGTNDAKKINWNNKEIFIRDYSKIIEKIGKDRLIIMTAPPTHYSIGTVLTNEYTTEEGVQEVNSLIREIAAKYNIKLIDNYGLIKANNSGFYVNDGIHFNEIGANFLAGNVYNKILGV